MSLERLLADLRETPGPILVVTGAGISLASGIPTFRGTDKDAVWQRDVTELATFHYFCTDPAGSWRWYLSRFAALDGAQPNDGHRALQQLEGWCAARRKPFILVTQNIDGLHARAGSQQLVEVHGSWAYLRCARDGCELGAPRGTIARDEVSLTTFIAEPVAANVPRCPRCGTPLRPHVLWFDEYYTGHESYQWSRVMEASETAQLVIFIGTSFSVGVTDQVLSAARARKRPVYSIDPAGTNLPGVIDLPRPAETALAALMKLLVCLLLLVCAPALAAPSPSPTPSPTPWSRVRTPTAAPPESIGGYSAGCVAGAVALPLTGPGFRVARPERNRVFGHPSLIGMIRDLARKLSQLHAPPHSALSVGDLGQPRGGPAPSGHASHQTGLDVDLWFLPPSGGHALSMVAGQRPSPRFDARAIRLLQLAALDERVDRIFVHPVLKRAVCQRTAPLPARGWLRKLRPWWGHDDHFHVRLACPAGSPDCVAQEPLPAGDGCDQLGWWFDKKAQADRERGHQSYSSKVGAAPLLPKRCDQLLATPR